MCGIAGFTGVCDPEVLSRFQAALHHRGPDERGRLCDSAVALSINRLAIIDLEHGQQPIFNEDGTCAIVFNGEIYNYRELREDLAKRHRFKTHSDTEVILHLYEEQGRETPRYLRGDFAFCIWDSRDRSCFLSRDHLGVKPLFYTVAGNRLIFASELTALLRHPDIKVEFDPASVAEYFAFMYVGAPRSLMRGIRKLRPGESLVWKNGCLETSQYWRIPEVENRTTDDREVRSNALDLLRTAVRRRLVADVPVGAFLSGGLDSSLIVALASEVRPGLHTFSIGYGDPDFDELEYARLVSTRFGTTHHEFIIRPEAESLIESVIAATDEPIADSSSIPAWLISGQTRKHMKVALSGIGGDEMFFGYPRYLGVKLSATLPAALRGPVSSASRLWSSRPMGRDWGGWIRRFGGSLGLSVADQYRAWTTFSDSTMRKELLLDGYTSIGDVEHEISAPLHETSGPVLDRIFRFDVSRYLAGDLLPLCDNMTMAQSIEVRVPFCDVDLVDGMARIPASRRFPGYRLKPILRDIAGSYLPSRIVHRKKQGFMVPVGKWFRGELREYVRGRLQPGQLPRFVNAGAVSRLLDEHNAGAANHTQLIWALLLLSGWCAKIGRTG